MAKPKTPAAVRLGKLRWANTTVEERREAAHRLVAARRAKRGQGPPQATEPPDAAVA